MDYYYGVDQSDGLYRGRVYHYRADGETIVGDFKGPLRDTSAEAVDDAAEWLETNQIEASPDGSW